MLSRIYEWLISKVVDAQDAKYWGDIFGMIGVACIAVAALELRWWALLVGTICCLTGLRPDRKGRKENDFQ